jgi:hypothetical protein
LKQPFLFSFLQGSVGTPEVSQVDVGDFRATVEHNAGGQEIIRISRQDSSTAVQPTVSMSGAHTSKTPEEMRWKQVRDLMLTVLTENENKREVVVPASVLRLYHQLLNKRLPSSPEASSAQLQTALLFAELVQLGAASKADQEDKTVILGQEVGDRPAGQAETEQNIQKGGESEILVKGAVKQIPMSRKLVNSVKSENNDDIVVGTLEEESCDSENESTEELRTSSDSENEDKHFGYGSDEL